MKTSWVEIVAKNSKLPDPAKQIEIKQPKNSIPKKEKNRLGTSKKHKNLHTCKWCNEDFEYQNIESHLNETHKTSKNFTYIFCSKCLFYLKVKNGETKEGVLKKHNADKHFFRNVKNNYYLKLDKIDKDNVMSAKRFLREVRNLQK